MNYLEADRRFLCTTAHYTYYKIFYSNTIIYRLTWGYYAAKKTAK